MVSGREIRLGRILKDGKMLCIPTDHGITDGPIKGLEDIHNLIYRCQHAGLTCVLVNKGIVKSMARPLDIGLIIHLSASTSRGPSPNKKVIIGSVEEALRLGADAVSVHINIGAKEEPEMLETLGMVSDKCNQWSMPLVAMMYPRGQKIEDPHDPVAIAHAARIGAEAGADIIKTVFTADPESFRRIVRSCPAPIVIAGGPKAKTDIEILRMCSRAMDAGAIGVTFGRNIFQHPNAPSMVRALRDIVIERKTIEEAVKHIDTIQK